MTKNNLIEKVIDNIEKVILGKREVITQLIGAIIADGHILIEDMPGVGKTTLVKALAKSIDLKFRRIQFTSDVMPTDITGLSIYNQKSMDFEFKEGPVFSNILLCDEINRASPKTQSALLEVMEERQITEWRKTYNIDAPFFVLATENAIEHLGTYKLPEAQLDRFMIKINIGYPSKENEMDIISIYKNNDPLEELKPVMSREDLISIQEQVKNIYVSKEVKKYLVDIAYETRNNSKLDFGISTRGILALLRIAQANAYMNGRDYVLIEDVKNNINLVLSHRIKLSFNGDIDNISVEDVLEEIKASIKIPKIKDYV